MCLALTMLLSGCGPELDDIGRAALIAGPAVLLICYLVPFMYQWIMRRGKTLHLGFMLPHMLLCGATFFMAFEAFEAFPSRHRDLSVVVGALALLSMLTYVQFGWLIWCYKYPKHRAGSMVLLLFATLYLLPAYLAAWGFPPFTYKDSFVVLLVLWVFPGFYGVTTLPLLILCTALAIIQRRKEARADQHTPSHLAEIFD